MRVFIAINKVRELGNLENYQEIIGVFDSESKAKEAIRKAFEYFLENECNYFDPVICDLGSLIDIHEKGNSDVYSNYCYETFEVQ